MSESPAFRIAQAVGLSGAIWLSGNIFSLSMMAIPALLQSHHEENIPLSTITKQWRAIYEFGKARAPPIALVTAITFLSLAWGARRLAPLSSGPGTGTSATTYYICAALTLAVIPWTGLAMGKTNAALIECAESGWVSDERSGEEVERLLWKWTWLNAARALFPLAGGLVGLWGFWT
ncbi:DUF1772-domain-containing protein [Aspergillus carlsbadensis]|nr:DUF1772-domain-containing protein [Aspergillus carlsbadensis]